MDEYMDMDSSESDDEVIEGSCDHLEMWSQELCSFSGLVPTCTMQ